jgi:predicted acyltransferase
MQHGEESEMSTTIQPPVNRSAFEPPVSREPVIESTVAPRPHGRERLVSLDVFRGITVAGMLLVNNPGTWDAIYPPLEHATWNGWTPTDLIFPFFLFIVGITTHLSLNARRARGDTDSMLVKQIIRRGAIIFLLGFLMAAFPFYQYGTAAGPNATLFAKIIYRAQHVRFLGVLPRIGLVYICAALLTLRTNLKQQVIILAVLLYGYWFAMELIPLNGTINGVPGRYWGFQLLNFPSETLAAHLDRAILGLNHIWTGSVTFDPEGPFSTVPAIGTSILGVIAGRWISQPKPLIERIAGLFAAGCLAMVVGLMWNWSFPINKNLWTSSYVIFTAGMACASIATIMWIVEDQHVRWWTKPFVIYGMNPIVAFVGSGVLARCIYTLWVVPYNGKPTPMETVIYSEVFAPWMEPKNASLTMAFVTVLFWFAILAWMYRRKIFLKV